MEGTMNGSVGLRDIMESVQQYVDAPGRTVVGDPRGRFFVASIGSGRVLTVGAAGFSTRADAEAWSRQLCSREWIARTWVVEAPNHREAGYAATRQLAEPAVRP